MITPRHTRLVRVPHLHAFRRSVVDLVSAAIQSGISAPLVVVPTRSAAHQLERLLESFSPATSTAPASSCERAEPAVCGRTDGAIRADIVTRDELYERLHARVDPALGRLAPLERDVIMQRAAREAAARTPGLPFRVRPGLAGEMLRFYDHLRRQLQQVDRFEELIVDALGRDDDGDRGASRLREQTAFLAAAFRGYEQTVRASQAGDEHLLRAHLIAQPAPDPLRRVVITVPDWIAGAGGLYQSDFDLLARIPGLEQIDIVATELVLASGFHERLHNWWPGIEEITISPFSPHQRPAVAAPDGAPADEPWWTFRDREEELVAVARQIKADCRRGIDSALQRRAVVFKAPLPYLYLAAEVFPAAAIPYQTSDALPLAIEPAAAAVDLALDAVSARFARNAIVSLLRSPHFVFEHDGREISRESISALNVALSRRQYLGELSRLQELAADWDQKDGAALPALQASIDLARALAALAEPHSASAQVQRLRSFLDRHLRALPADDECTDSLQAARTAALASRARRSRAAIAQTLSALASIHEVHDDPPWTIDDLAIAVRRALEDQTFESAARGSGVHLVNDQAARYGEFDEIAIVGVVESEWPERPRRNIFYPPALLKALGWPAEKDWRAGADAQFLDLLASPSRCSTVSTFTLENDALVERSTELDLIPQARLPTVAREPAGDARVFVDEALSFDPVVVEPLDEHARAWAAVRMNRTPAEEPQFHGQVGAPPAPPALTVSALETYLQCPFKYFAQHVLKLEDEPEDDEVMDPKRQGRFLHHVFEAFFRRWQASGGGAMTPRNLDRARALFTEVVDDALAQLPAAEAGLERTRLLGSPAAAGLGEAVLRMEAERPVPVVERLLEYDLRGEFSFATAAGSRAVWLRGKADRIDLLADGTFRLIDYKLGWPPNRARALQLPIYGVCAEQHLTRSRRRAWTLGEAAYVAFKGPRRVVPLFSSDGDRSRVLGEAQQRLVDTVDAVARGEFPPAPDDVWRCETCSFSSVCRKDYVGDV